MYFDIDMHLAFNPESENNISPEIPTETIPIPEVPSIDSSEINDDGNISVQIFEHFEHIGEKIYDKINNCYVIGNLESDMKFVGPQTPKNDCSLMAQAQFIERFTGIEFSPEQLQEYAQKLGVYDPTVGTNIAGHTALLAEMNVPFSRMGNCTIDQLNEILLAHNDVLLSVNAQEFYDDITIPPNSGHAVAIISYGVDNLGEITGYYFSDTNNHTTPIFKSIEDFQEAWNGDIIAIPELSEKYILGERESNVLGASKPLKYDVFGNVVDEYGRRLYLHSDQFGSRFKTYPQR